MPVSPKQRAAQERMKDMKNLRDVKRGTRRALLAALTAFLLLATALQSLAEDGMTVDCVQRGLRIAVSQEYLDKGVELEGYNEDLKGNPIYSVYYYYRPITDALMDEFLALDPTDRTPEVDAAFYEQMYAHSRCLMWIVLLEKEDFDARTAAGTTLDELSGQNNTQVLGENDGYIYLVSIPDLDTAGMNEEEAQQYQDCRTYMEEMRESIEFIPVVRERFETAVPDMMPAFVTHDLEGTEVNGGIFAQQDLTVVNLWGTFCTPCIEEMPELGAWANELPKNVRLVGVVTDIADEADAEHLELARLILKKAGADFTNLIANADFSGLMEGVIGVPTTLFVDRTGRIVGEPIVGADVAAYKRFVEDYLHELE